MDESSLELLANARAGDRDALAASIRRFFDDDALRERLRAAAAGSVRAFDRDTVFARLERALEEAVRR